MKKTFVYASVILGMTLASCSQNKTSQDSTLKTEVDTVETFEDHHNAENSLDVEGHYEGLIPCADCSGITVHLHLNADKTYKILRVYDKGGAKNSEFTETGNWNIKVNTLTLTSSTNEISRYKVGENVLFMLNQDGSEIESAHKEMYQLKKQ